MGYILGQYNKEEGSADDALFMTPLTDGWAERMTEDSGEESAENLFLDECAVIGGVFESNKPHYFHAIVKRMASEQIFYVKLADYDGIHSNTTQFIKTITIQAGDPHEWVHIEFVFTPLAEFDTVLFKLKRTAEDYTEDARVPVFIFLELSLINNIIPQKIEDGISLMKIGVQGRPGLMMCINGEEIHVGRSGLYEIRNGIISIDFFSVFQASSEEAEGFEDIADEESYINEMFDDYDLEALFIYNLSDWYFYTTKIRTIGGFTLDYLYEEEE